MTGFNDRFGGDTINPEDVAYRAYTLTADLVTQWPPYADMTNVLARSMNVEALLAGLKVWLADAQEASLGETVTFYNNGAFAYDVVGAEGLAIATIAPGERRYLILTDNATADGTWTVTLLGVGTGTLDIAGAAGAGLLAIGAALNVAFPVTTVASSRAITSADRDKVLVWTGGTGTLTLPASASLTNFNFEIRNQGTGVVTISPTGGELIDNAVSAVFNNAESAWIHAGAAAWYTVGRGRTAQFAFTQLQKTVTGGTYALTLTEASNVVQTYTGALVSNQDIVLPSVVQVYYVSNQTTGAFDLRFKNSGIGSTVSIPVSTNAILFSDGTNVINASTTIAGITSIAFGAGTVGAPSVSINGVNNGFYSPGSGQVGFSSSGVLTFLMNAAGAIAQAASNAVLGVQATAGTALVTVARPAGAEGGLQLQTGALPRWLAFVDNAAESGGSVGSNFQIRRYNDAGVSLGSPITITRSTGLISLAGSVIASGGNWQIGGGLTVVGRASTPTVAVAFSATPSFDASLSNVFSFGALTANVTSTSITSLTDGQTIMIRVLQDGTGGRTFAGPAGSKIGGSINLTASSVSWLTLTYTSVAARLEGYWSQVPA